MFINIILSTQPMIWYIYLHDYFRSFFDMLGISFLVNIPWRFHGLWAWFFPRMQINNHVLILTMWAPQNSVQLVDNDNCYMVYGRYDYLQVFSRKLLLLNCRDRTNPKDHRKIHRAIHRATDRRHKALPLVTQWNS